LDVADVGSKRKRARRIVQRRRLSKAAQVGTDHAIEAGQIRHHVEPELARAGEPVDQDDGFGLAPAVGVVVNGIMQRRPVAGLDDRHVCAPRQFGFKWSSLASCSIWTNSPDAYLAASSALIAQTSSPRFSAIAL